MSALLCLPAFMQGHLTEVDWKLNLVLSNDQVASLREPRLMLNLTVGNSTGGSEDIVVEMSKKELEEAITALSKASEVVKQVA
jgi:hypothetical protein